MANTWNTTLLVQGGLLPIYGIAVDNNGDIYFTKGIDGLYRLKKYDTKPICIVIDGSFRGIVWNGNNILYICDWFQGILSYNIDTGTLSTLAGIGKEQQDGNIKDTTFYHPYGIAMDMNGDLYITEQHCVRKIHLSKETVETIAGSGERGYLDGEAKKAKFNDPQGIAVSSDGTIYVADYRNDCIRQIKDGIVSTIAGIPGQREMTDGRLRDSKFMNARGLLLDDDGTLFVADDGGRIRRVDINQDTVQTLPLNIHHPLSLVTDSEGNLYVGARTSLHKVDGFGEFRISASLNNMTTWKHIRLFLVGDSGAGKTSVVRWLKGDPFISEHNSTDSVDVTTADINSWKSVTFDIKDYMADSIIHTNTPQENNTSSLASDNNRVQVHELIEEIKPYSTTTKENTQIAPLDEPQASQVALPTILSIDLQCRIEKTAKISQAFHVWDFAGQEEYYNTHHFFLSDDAMYLLVVDISKPLQLERIKFWLDSVRFYSSNSPILIIGTHKDQVGSYSLSGLLTNSREKQAAVAMQTLIDFTQSYSISHVCCISCKYEQPNDFKKLLSVMVKNSVKQKPCKLSWLLLFDTVTKAAHNQSLSYLSLSKVENLASEYKMDLQEIKKALKFYHDLGFMFYFDEPQLDDIVFTEPQQLIDVLKTVITALGLKQLNATELRLLKEEGRATFAMLAKLWINYPQELHIKFRELLKVFGLAFGDPVQLTQGTSDNICDLIIPCLVQTPAHHFTNNYKNSPIHITCTIRTVPPLGFAAHLLSRILNLTQIQGTGISKCMMFKGGCIFQYKQIAFCLTTSPGKVIIQSKGFTHSSDIVSTLQAILQQIYLTASAHTTTADIVTTATCFNYSKCKTSEDVIANLQEGKVKTDVNFVYDHFCCKPCRVVFFQIPLSPQPVPVEMGQVMQLRFIDIVTEESHWKKLCLILDTSQTGGWRDLGAYFGMTVMELDGIAVAAGYQKETPARLFLKHWQHDANATMKALVDALKAINNETAREFLDEIATIRRNANSNQNQSRKDQEVEGFYVV